MGDISTTTVVILCIAGGIVGIPAVALIVGCIVSGIKEHHKTKNHIATPKAAK